MSGYGDKELFKNGGSKKQKYQQYNDDVYGEYAGMGMSSAYNYGNPYEKYGKKHKDDGAGRYGGGYEGYGRDMDDYPPEKYEKQKFTKQDKGDYYDYGKHKSKMKPDKVIKDDVGGNFLLSTILGSCLREGDRFLMMGREGFLMGREEFVWTGIVEGF